MSNTRNNPKELTELAGPIVIERTFNAPIAKVWKAITDPAEMKQWYLDLPEFKPEIGHEFEFTGGSDGGKQYRHLCKVIGVSPEKSLTYTWRYDGYDGDSRVTFDRFTTLSQMWMKPGDKPQQSSGSSDHTWVMGGRFLKMEFQGDVHGQPYEGLGYLGYDNVRGEHTGIWLDNMNTGIMRSSGQFDVATKTLTESGTMSCPMTGEKDQRFHGEWKSIDSDTLLYTMYHVNPDGTEMKGMEITYKRLK